MPYILKKYYPVRKILFFFGEGTLIFLTITTVYALFSGSALDPILVTENSMRALLATVTFQFSLYLFDLYALDWEAGPLETLTLMVEAFGFGCVLLAILYFLFPALIIATTIFWTCYLIIILILLGWRSLYHFILRRQLFSRPILIVGTDKLSSEIAREIEGKNDSGFKVAAFIGSNLEVHNPRRVPVITASSGLSDIYRDCRAERIVVALENRRGNMPVEELLQCKLQGITIEDGISFLESITGKILVENVNPAWLIFSDGFHRSQLAYLLKRLLDLVLSVSGLVLTLPLTLLTAVLIKLESPGPVFYRQERIGEKGCSFWMIKFRSMCQGAEKGEALWAQANDCRVTRIGQVIRKLRIDEIPQMWNVLKGEMSFVGPRPERPVFVKQLTESIVYYSLRHSIKPGITGWAQVCYPYGASVEDALRKLEYDLYYIKNLSIFIDFLIIFRTIKTVLLQKGSR